jgi:hypothetical protein
MISARSKYSLHTIGGCFSYPAVGWVMISTVFTSLQSGVVGTGASQCHATVSPFCYGSKLVLFGLVAFLSIWGTAVSWSDLLTGRREIDPTQKGISSILRSSYLVERNWMVIPIAAVAIVLAWLWK